MDINHYTKKDHELGTDLMQSVIATQDAKKRTWLFTQTRSGFSLPGTDDATFYKTVAEATRRQKAQQKKCQEKESRELNDYLHHLNIMPLESEVLI